MFYVWISKRKNSKSIYMIQHFSNLGHFYKKKLFIGRNKSMKVSFTFLVRSQFFTLRHLFASGFLINNIWIKGPSNNSQMKLGMNRRKHLQRDLRTTMWDLSYYTPGDTIFDVLILAPVVRNNNTLSFSQFVLLPQKYFFFTPFFQTFLTTC